jgi:hypothetical protein
MNGLRAGMSAAPLMAAARVAAGVTSLTCQNRTSRWLCSQDRQHHPIVKIGQRLASEGLR